MAASKNDISRWFDNAIKQCATHMIVVCDTWDYDDYPVYVLIGEDVHSKENEYNGKEMQQVMEVYCMSKDKDMQLSKPRCFEY